MEKVRKKLLSLTLSPLNSSRSFYMFHANFCLDINENSAKHNALYDLPSFSLELSDIRCFNEAHYLHMLGSAADLVGMCRMLNWRDTDRTQCNWQI